MAPKLMLILLGLGFISLAVLAQRQQRIDAACELTRIHDRCDQVRTSLWEVRSQIATHMAQQPGDDPSPLAQEPRSQEQRVARVLPGNQDVPRGG